ncbi:MAG: hypothetical protein FD167_1179, partial [bacterium]
NTLKDRYSNLEKLPILQLPEVVRNSDPTLTHLPHYKLSKYPFTLQIGSKVIALSIEESYSEWDDLVKESRYLFNILNTLKFIEKVSRFAIRYINFFENMDIFQQINLSISPENPLDNIAVISDQMSFRTLVKDKKFHTNLLISNNIEMVKIKENSKMNGSIIDLDTYLLNIEGEFFSKADELLLEAHSVEKTLFFSLLKEEFINTLNPEY